MCFMIAKSKAKHVPLNSCWLDSLVPSENSNKWSWNKFKNSFLIHKVFLLSLAYNYTCTMMMCCLKGQVPQLKLLSDHNCGSQSSFAAGDISPPVTSGHKQKGQWIRRLSCTWGKYFPLWKNKFYCLLAQQSSHSREREKRVQQRQEKWE